MEIFIFKIHSTIDVITNSSSEIFVCNTDKDIETVTEILKNILDICNKMNDEYNYEFEECFRPVRKLEVDADIKSYLMGIAGFEIDYPPYSTINWAEEINKMEKEWVDKEMNYNIDKYRNCIIIESTSDNTIPFESFDMIESGFNAERTHLG